MGALGEGSGWDLRVCPPAAPAAASAAFGNLGSQQNVQSKCSRQHVHGKCSRQNVHGKMFTANIVISIKTQLFTSEVGG